MGYFGSKTTQTIVLCPKVLVTCCREDILPKYFKTAYTLQRMPGFSTIVMTLAPELFLQPNDIQCNIFLTAVPSFSKPANIILLYTKPEVMSNHHLPELVLVNQEILRQL